MTPATRSERLSVRVTEAQKTSLHVLALALNRMGLQVTESQLIEFLISTNHSYRETPADLAPALIQWRAAQEAQ